MSIEVDLIRLWSAVAMVWTTEQVDGQFAQQSADYQQQLHENQQGSINDGHVETGS
ncbi:MAG: hypothetical protein IPK97_03020 [Ahniella sp.]|nr:hypothetical protein [Ahniella sp.]